jgi:plastocyanin
MPFPSFRIAAVALLGAGVLLSTKPHPARAGGGSVVSGTIKIAGPAPKPTVIKVTKDASSCGAEYAGEAARVDASGGLANVVVTLRPLKPAAAVVRPAPAKATLDQVGCRYQPHVQAVGVGTEVTLINSDRVLHNVHGNVGPVTVFNVAMPIKGQRLPTKLTRPGLVRLQCDAGHTWMNAWIYVVEHPHYAVTDAAGHFEIPEVPPGDNTVELWHEPLDGKGAGTTQTSRLTVSDDKPARADVTFKL